MQSLIKIVFIGFLLFFIQTAFAQADTARRFQPKENRIADKNLKREIQQKQLLEKPVQLNTVQGNTVQDKVVAKKKFIKKTYKKKRRNTSK